MRQLTILILVFLALTSLAQDKGSFETTKDIYIGDPMPAYPGGFDSLKAFIKKNLKYPKGTTWHGAVYVEFIVTENGSTTDFKIVKGLCDICDENAIEALKKMPKWIPAIRHDKPTRTKMILSVKYEL